MYESPIQMIVTKMQSQIEEQEGRILMKAVHDVGFDVDKHELMKALAYDRNQYQKGYDDAMRNAVPLDKLCEWLAAEYVSIPCHLCDYFENGKCSVENDMKTTCPNSADDWGRLIMKWMEG